MEQKSEKPLIFTPQEFRSEKVTRDDLYKLARDSGLEPSHVDRILAMMYQVRPQTSNAWHGKNPTTSVVCDTYKHDILLAMNTKFSFHRLQAECRRCDKDSGSKHNTQFSEVGGRRWTRRWYGKSVYEPFTQSLVEVIIDKGEKESLDIHISVKFPRFLDACEEVLSALRKKFEEYTHSYTMTYCKKVW